MNHFLLFEFGSTSLKVHFQLQGDSLVRKVKTPWTMGHEIFETGRISRESTDQAVSTIRMFLAWMTRKDGREVPGFATGAFRVARNAQAFLNTVQRRTGLAVRRISEREEASLLHRLVHSKLGSMPEFFFDLGGGSIQWVSANREANGGIGSIPLGAIRLLRMARDDSGTFVPRLADRLAEEHLSALPRLSAERVQGTGGTVGAISSVLEKPLLRLSELQDLYESVQRAGPPPTLMPHRRCIFLPGLILVLRLMETLGAAELHHLDLTVGEAMVRELQGLLPRGARPLCASGVG